MEASLPQLAKLGATSFSTLSKILNLSMTRILRSLHFSEAFLKGTASRHQLKHLAVLMIIKPMRLQLLPLKSLNRHQRQM
jgi:hypothetical protein